MKSLVILLSMTTTVSATLRLFRLSQDWWEMLI